MEERVRTTGCFSSQRGETSGLQGPRSQGKVKNRIAVIGGSYPGDTAQGRGLRGRDMSHLSLWPEEMSRGCSEMLELVEWGVEKAHASCFLKNRVGWGLERALVWEWALLGEGK